MHESALSRTLLEAVLCLAQERGAKRVRRVVGELAETEYLHADAIGFHFAAHARGTAAEGAAVELALTDVGARCRACGTSYQPEHHLTLCPTCGGTEAELLGTPGLRIDSLDIE